MSIDCQLIGFYGTKIVSTSVFLLQASVNEDVIKTKLIGVFVNRIVDSVLFLQSPVYNLDDGSYFFRICSTCLQIYLLLFGKEYLTTKS